MKKSILKILVIRFSSIGDIVLTSPVVRCLKQQRGADIHYLTKRPYLPLLEANPFIDQIFLIDQKVSEVLPALKAERYDLIVDLHKNLRSWQVRLALGAKAFAFDKLNLEKWIFTRWKLNQLPALHIVDRYLAAVAPLGVKNDGLGLDYFFPSGQPPYTVGQPGYLAFAIGAAHATKRLPEHKILEICRAANGPVVLLGGKAESAIGEAVAQQVGGRVRNLCGRLSLHESASVLQQAARVITHDTGMMHIAAAFQKEILSVWGNTVPAFGMAPYFGNGGGKDTRSEVQGLGCRPCSKIGFGQCPKGHFRCMEDQDTAAISAWARGGVG